MFPSLFRRLAGTVTLCVLPVLASPALSQPAAEMTPDEIRQSHVTHAALAQFHRWFLLYENADSGLQNALDILAPDVFVKSSLGEARGHAEYSARIAQIPQEWQNSHSVTAATVTPQPDGTVQLNATVNYINKGMLPDGALRGAELDYSVSLGTDLPQPLLQSVEITPKSALNPTAFIDLYAENRMRSLVHYWLALIENPDRAADPVREILATPFTLNFSSGAITDFQGFSDWLAGPASSVAASTHQITEFDVTQNTDQTYTIDMEFDWAGLLPDGTKLIAKTHHIWTVENDASQRFARVRSMDVEVLEPFRPAAQ